MPDPDRASTPAEVTQPAPSTVKVVVDGVSHELRFDQAFALACDLLEKGAAREASKLFERLEEFPDRGPRAFIMQAFCEASTLNFEKCSKPLRQALAGQDQSVAEALHAAFVSYHVGIRQDALESMTKLVNEHTELPTLCLLLGNMLRKEGKLSLARRCWTLAVKRDRTGGAVAAAAGKRLTRYPTKK
jgi:predicted Zn-dependent protease